MAYAAIGGPTMLTAAARIEAHDKKRFRELATEFAERLRGISAVKARNRILETLKALRLEKGA